MKETDNTQADVRGSRAVFTTCNLIHPVRGWRRHFSLELSFVRTATLLATCVAFGVVTSPLIGRTLSVQNAELSENFKISGVMTSAGGTAKKDQQLVIELSVVGSKKYRVSASEREADVIAQFGQCDGFAYQFRSQPSMGYDLADVALTDSSFLILKNNPGIMLGLLVVQELVDPDKAEIPGIFKSFSYFNQEAFEDLVFTNVVHSQNSMRECRVYCRVKGLAETARPLLLGALSLNFGSKTNGAALATLTLYDPFWANVESKQIFQKYSFEMAEVESLNTEEFECAPIQTRTIHVTDSRNPSAAKQFDVRPGEWQAKVIGTMRGNQLRQIAIVLTLIILTGVAVYFARRVFAKS